MRSLLVAALAAVAAAIEAEEVEREFAKFVHKYRKEYDDDDDRKMHMAAFRVSLEYIQGQTAKNSSYQVGLNEHADLTPREFGTTRLGFTAAPENVFMSKFPLLGAHQSSGDRPLPASVDWRTTAAAGPVLNQGKCGACWAFSATGAISSAWQIQHGEYVNISQQQLLDCSTNFNQGCRGGSMEPAFMYAEEHPLCTEGSYQYEQEQGKCHSSCTVGIPKGGVIGYRRVQPGDERALMEAVAQQPVSIGIEGENYALQLYKSGVFQGECGSKPNHGVLLMGYGTENGQDYWLVKNSWGPTWGEDGYFKLLRGNSGVDGKLQGECGILMMPTYPVVSGGSSPSPSPSTPTEAPPTDSPPTDSPPTDSPPPPADEPAFYERPPCTDYELRGVVRGDGGGEVCAPSCHRSSCPAAPAGVSATPSCAFRDNSFWGRFMGLRYCALLCSDSAACPAGARCSHSGVCVYAMESAQRAVLGAPPTLELDTPSAVALDTPSAVELDTPSPTSPPVLFP